MTEHHVIIVSYAGVLGLELFGAVDVLNLANRFAVNKGRTAPYNVQVLSVDGSAVPMSGLEVGAAGSLREYQGPVDTLLVPGGPGGVAASADAALVGAIRDLAARARRLVSFSTGAFLLAEAGLLNGRTVSTHWQCGQLLAERYPALVVDTDPVFTYEDSVATSAGVTAGFDLMLALVEEDLGTLAARSIAGDLVLHLRRTGHQAQFSVQLSAPVAQRAPIRELQQFIADHPDADLSLETLAGRVHMSPRHFARVFGAEVGQSPGRYVEQVRVEAARRRLETGDLPLVQVAAACGFGSTETLRRVFVQTIGVSPTEYRRRLRRGNDAAGLFLVG